MKTLATLVMPHGPWLIYEPYAREQWAALSRISIESHGPEKVSHVARLRSEVKAARSGDSGRDYETRDGIAVFDLTGPMTKIASSLGGGTGTAKLRQMIESATRDEDVKGAVLRVDSPGGSVAGTDDLARAISAFCRKKPMHAYIEDLGASAAYWAASSCSKVFANPTALVGSLGTFAVVMDMSRMAQNQGIEVHVLSTGKYKGAGTPGSEITDEQLANYQGTVDDLNEHFINGVARGRSMPKARVRELFDGAVHQASKAFSLGLIDGIGSFYSVLDGVRQAAFAKAEDYLDTRATIEQVEPDDWAPESTISSQDKPPASLSLAEETAALLASAKVCIDNATRLQGHLSRLKATRQEDGRDLGPKALGHIDEALASLDGLSASLDETAAEIESLRPAKVDRSALEREIALARISLAS